MKPLTLEQLEQMDAYLAGALSDAEHKHFEHLLADSQALRDELQLIQDMRLAFTRLPEMTCPDRVTTQVMAAVDQELKAHYQQRLRAFWHVLVVPTWRPALAVAALGLLVVAVLVFRNPAFGPTSPKVAQQSGKLTPKTSDNEAHRKRIAPMPTEELAANLPPTTEAPGPTIRPTSLGHTKRTVRRATRKAKDVLVTPSPRADETFSDEDIALAKDQAQWIMAFLGTVAKKSESIQAQYMEDHVVEPVRLAAAAPFEVLNQ
ncbi:MAG: hypothetical protein JNN12_07175 [Bacteroidetes Order II. Incertae sedis bacterium]|nr:hypothetical protein [Bacteroidetes Order II. bacterium]